MILDAVISCLLLVTIVYCWRLSKKVAALNASRKELHDLIGEFNTAILRAESGITSLKELNKEADDNLQQHIEKARLLSNDLAFLSHKGDSIADRLESYISGMRVVDSSRPLFRGTNKSSQVSAFTSTPAKPLVRRAPQEKAPLKDAGTPTLGWKQVEKKRALIAEPAPQQQQPALELPQESAASKQRALEEVLAQIEARKKKYTARPVMSEASLEE